MNRIYKKAIVTLAIAGLTANAYSADASTPDDPLRTTTLRLIELLVEQGVLTREKADALIREANRPVAASPAPASSAQGSVAPAPGSSTTTPGTGTIRVPYIPEFVREDLKNEIRQELVAQAQQDGWAPPNSIPDWVRTMKWEGDLRVRFEHDGFASGNAPFVNIVATNSNRALTLLNTTDSTERERVLARAGFTVNLDNETSAGFRLATGSASDPLSENQTLGSYETRYQVALDRAYIKFQPYEWIAGTLGRFANPLVSTDLVWAPDLSFDGVLLKLTPNFGSETRPFLTAMASPVQEIDVATHNKYLYSTQVGVDQDLGSGTRGKLALGYYRYTGIEGVLSPPGTSIDEYTAPLFAQKGNTYYDISSNPNSPLLGLASSFHELDLTGSIDSVVSGPYHAILTADYVKNLGFNQAAVSERVGTPVSPETTGYLLRVLFGKPELKLRDDWQVFLTYKRIERDSVLDAFTDPDFHLGGTDAKGYVVGASYGLAKNTWATVRYFSTDAISGPPLSIDTLQFDIYTHF